MTDIKSLLPEELIRLIKEYDEKGFRADQIFMWLHKYLVCDFDEMTNIPSGLKDKLRHNCSITDAKIVKKLESNKDNTIKYLFEMTNNIIIESVLMKYSYGNSICISSQAGCRMGCRFCASTFGGLERNLSVAEMLEQVYKIQRDAGKVSRIVIMGSGEPFDNYDNVIKFIRLVNSKNGLNIGQRHITLSTCGIIPKIYRLADEGLQITLAISLHAPNDLVREKLMPISKKMPVDDVIKAGIYYSGKTKRRVTYEYALIYGINDSPDLARELSSKIKNTLAHVNIIPINAVKETGFKKSSNETVLNFAKIIESQGIETTIRRKLGSDIDSACGQLRKRYKRCVDESSRENGYRQEKKQK